MAIARAAGVSVSTVSRALSNAPGISEERRSQILKLAHEAGYPGRARPGAGKRMVLSYVNSSVATGGLAPFYETIVRALTQAAEEAGMTLGMRLLHASALDSGRLIREAAAESPLATLFIGIDVPEEVAASYLTRPAPLILVNGYDPRMRFDCVAPNNFYGGMLATRALIEAGHRSVLMVEDHLRWTTVQRRRGFRAAVEAADGVRGRLIGLSGRPETALAEEIEHRRTGQSDWTGIFCINDMCAIRVIGALEAAGIHVPRDVSVIGFDDLPYAAMAHPPLSTVTVDTDLIGRQAVALLQRRLAEPGATPLQVECAVRAKAGGTLAQPAQNQR